MFPSLRVFRSNPRQKSHRGRVLLAAMVEAPGYLDTLGGGSRDLAQGHKVVGGRGFR